jgi:hypothetical protein
VSAALPYPAGSSDPAKLPDGNPPPILPLRAGPPAEEWAPSPYDPAQFPPVTWMLWTPDGWLPVDLRATAGAWQLWHPAERRWMACESPWQCEQPFPGGRAA